MSWTLVSQILLLILVLTICVNEIIKTIKDPGKRR